MTFVVWSMLGIGYLLILSAIENVSISAALQAVMRGDVALPSGSSASTAPPAESGPNPPTQPPGQQPR